MLILPALIGMAGMAIEYGDALMIRTRNQRVADSAAYAAALAYNAQSNSISAAQSAANRIAALNGLADATTVAQQVTSPSNAARSAIQVTITQRAPLLLSSVVYGPSSVAVPVRATAELISVGAVPANCITAIDGGSSGITVSGGANITANSCGVASNANITVSNCGAYIQSSGDTYANNLVVPTNCGAGQSPLRKADGTAQTAVKAAVADPYANNSAVAAAASRLSTVSAMAAPAAPSVSVASGGNLVTFKGGYNASDVTDVDNQARSNGCRAYWTSNAWDYECPAGSTTSMQIGNICGGCTLQLNTSANTATTLNINSSITAAAQMTFGQGTFNINGNYTGGYGGTIFNGIALNVTGYVNVGSSGTVTFGSGTYNIAQGLYLNGSTTTTFGSGTFNIGTGTISCSGGNYSICALSSGTTTFAGPAVFNLSGGIRTGGGATLNLGSGSNNSFVIGASSDGYAFRGDGGAVTNMADAASGGNVYQFGGNVNLTGGGSCLVIGVAPNHDIKGSLWGTGAMKLGDGLYTVTGTVNFGGSGGGNANCGGSNIGVYANNVTFVIGAASGTTATSGDCAGQAFCLSAGYSSVVINAPTSGGGTAGFAVIGPQSASNTAGGNFTAGASGTRVTGVLYMPNGALSFSGGASLGDASANGGCLEVVGKSISVTAGGLLGSSCVSSSGLGTPAGFSVKLVG